MTKGEKLTIFLAAVEKKTYRYAAAHLRLEYHARGQEVKQADYDLLEEMIQKRFGKVDEKGSTPIQDKPGDPVPPYENP